MRPTMILAASALVLSTGLAFAQTNAAPMPGKNAPSSAQSNGQPAVTHPNTSEMKAGDMKTGAIAANAKLEEGANSFTEGQVRSRLEGAGFKNITDLKKDDKGIWRGKADHAGKSVQFGFDFKGNVAIQ